MYMRKAFALYIVGNAFMAFSFLFLVWVYYPIVKLYLFPQSYKQNIVDTSFLIEIPKMNVRAAIISEVDPFNEKEYRAALQKGIAHAKGTSLPGEKGTSFLFAHSSDAPWRMSRYNTIFFRLGELEKKDTIIIRRDGKEYRYQVTDKKTVWPNEVSYLVNAQDKQGSSNRNQLILQTCTPIGTSFQRLLVFAEMV